MMTRGGLAPSCLAFLALSAMLVALPGCSRQAEIQPPPPSPTGAAQTVPSGGELQGSLTIKGSDTMVHLVTAWAEAFMKQHPQVNVSVTGGGSGTGIAALINGTTDLCAASRKMKDEEKTEARAKGHEPVETVVARDGIAVVVNPANPVSELTVEQLGKIFTGATTNWQAVGGPSQPIEVLSRESSSGTYAFFREHVMHDEDYTEKAKLMAATSAIIEAVAQDQWSIGYVGLGYALEAGERVKPLKVKASADSEAVAPSEETVRSGAYPIARPLHLYTAGEPAGAAKAFVDFALSPEGQTIVTDSRYVPVK